jgi:hypothetical protein
MIGNSSLVARIAFYLLGHDRVGDLGRVWSGRINASLTRADSSINSAADA